MRKLLLFIFLISAAASAAQPPVEQTASVDQAVARYRDAATLTGAPKKYRIRSISVHGAPYLDRRVILSSAGLVEGDSIWLPGNFPASVIERLWAQKLFSDVQLGAQVDGDQMDMDLLLTERPRVNYWLFSGVSKSQQKELLEKLKLKRGTELSDYALEKNKQLIKTHYAGKGFRNAVVQTTVTDDSLLKAAVNVTFRIDRRKRVRIGAIDFEGNHAFTDKRLRAALKKTHQKSINFLRSSKFKPSDFETDKDELIDFYNSRGYRNATILSDSVYNINDKRIGIRIAVDEGHKFYIRNVTWVGNSIYPTEMLAGMFGVQRGTVYDKRSMYKRLGIPPYGGGPDDTSILSMYKDAGYLASQIDPAEIIVGTDSIDMELRVFEGKQYTINSVGISGNARLDDESIRRELSTRPGELYSQSLLFQTMHTLNAMGHFDPATIAPDIQPVENSDNKVDINWPLTEKGSDQFQIAGGYGGGTFVGSIGVTLNNLSMKNFFKKGAWRPYPSGQNQKLAISAQSNGTYYKAISLSFTDPWLGGRKPNSLTVSTHYSVENNAIYAWQRSTSHFRTTGVAVGIGKRLTWPDPMFQLYFELGYDRYMLKQWSGFIFANGNSNLFSAKAVFSRNSVDQPIYPRRGSEFSLSLQITPPYSLWDGLNYGSDKLSNQERYRWIEFHKWTLKGQWFTPLSRNGNLVLMTRAEMGYLGHYNKNKVSPFERFEVGGDGMTGYSMYGTDVVALRGYSDAALDPYNSKRSIAYNKYTLELRYPILMKGQTNIYALAFAEGGNGFESWKTFSPLRIKRSAGVGVRLFLPVVGMIGVSWGYGFDPASYNPALNMHPKASGGHVHFELGIQF